MCGIAGFCGISSDFTHRAAHWQNVLTAMQRTLAHRGPDQNGTFLAPQVGLAHTRLSIRDVRGGTQPMERGPVGRRCVLVYNGEIYNTRQLRPDLQRRGCRFETTGDTEVLLYAYLQYGPAFVERLNGIFAFAIWDEAKQQLLLYRDRLGVKPLFYAQRGQTLIFGSEPKALFAHPEVTPQADLDSFRELFGIGPARTPGCGVFCGVQEVLPGCVVTLDRDGLRQRPYWTLRAREHRDDEAATVEKVSWLLRDAVKQQMVSDVPVCSFLSGGLDSSIVTALASNFLAEQGGQLNTFSFDFAHNDTCFQANAFQPTRDRPYVERMVQLYPVHHTYLECDEATLVDWLPKSLYSKDLPGMADVDASLLYFCGLVKQHNKVALTGECADEIFGGYPWFYREELWQAETFPWSPDLNARTLLLSDAAQKELGLHDYVQTRYEETLRQVPHLPGENAMERRRREISYLNLRWFMQTLLDRIDRASMACGLEARVPFADHRIVEYLYNVPWSMKYKDGHEKALLRAACADLLPPDLLYRKKSPYPKTYAPQYEQLLVKQFRAMLDDRRAPIHRFLDRERAERFLAAPKDYGKPWFGQLMAGPQLLAYYLQVNTWMEHCSIR